MPKGKENETTKKGSVEPLTIDATISKLQKAVLSNNILETKKAIAILNKNIEPSLAKKTDKVEANNPLSQIVLFEGKN
ncbi:MAG: hypothetical protein K0R98_1837 [Rickettsiaceae bacterium]|nr:hypothetical protein [Rickettsiaceae bacterium]